MISQREKMLAGELYDPHDPQLSRERLRARELCYELNHCRPGDLAERRRLLTDLLGSGGDTVWLETPFRCDYGTNITLGKGVYFNFDCVILDVCQVKIGSRVFCGPGVHIYTATHPIDAIERRDQEFGQPVTIGDDVWIGGRAVLCPGITIGSRSVIGAGSVVTRDIRSDAVAAGNPARIIRRLEPLASNDL